MERKKVWVSDLKSSVVWCFYTEVCVDTVESHLTAIIDCLVCLHLIVHCFCFILILILVQLIRRVLCFKNAMTRSMPSYNKPACVLNENVSLIN